MSIHESGIASEALASPPIYEGAGIRNNGAPGRRAQAQPLWLKARTTMAYKNRLGGHTNSYHTYSLEEALEGIAAAGFRYVELSAVRGWTEQIPLDADGKTLSKVQRTLNQLGLIPVSLSGHSDLTTKEGAKQG